MNTTTLLDELMKIPTDATNAEIRGVNMQIIDPYQAQKMMDEDLGDNYVHECILANGRFLFVCEKGTLKYLYKVSGNPRLSDLVY